MIIPFQRGEGGINIEFAETSDGQQNTKKSWMENVCVKRERDRVSEREWESDIERERKRERERENEWKKETTTKRRKKKRKKKEEGEEGSKTQKRGPPPLAYTTPKWPTTPLLRRWANGDANYTHATLTWTDRTRNRVSKTFTRIATQLANKNEAAIFNDWDGSGVRTN